MYVPDNYLLAHTVKDVQKVGTILLLDTGHMRIETCASSSSFEEVASEEKRESLTPEI